MSHNTAPAWFQQVHDLTLQLVRIPSVTNSADELRFAEKLHALLAAQPYFQAHPAHLRIERAPEDPYGRMNVFALVGGGPRTVVLSGHYDVVSTENYGALAQHACDPEALAPALIAELQAGAHSDSDRLALADLRGGQYMPGRGALDMKSGLAVGIALLLRLAAQPERQGSLLLIATPDEEQTSQGMRAAATRLPGLLREWQLDAVTAINLDCTTDRGDGQEGQVIFLGSVGKLLPSVYIVGRDTHAGAPFDGISANRLAAEITRQIECNPELADAAEGETAPPPVCLKQIDLKAHYDVTTPASAWCYYNLLTHSWAPGEALAKIRDAVQAAMHRAIAETRAQAQRYAQRSGTPDTAPEWRAQVLSFAELRRIALERDAAAGPALDTLLAQLADDPQLDLPTYSLRITELLWKHSGLSGPAAVLGLAALYYPRVLVGDSGARQIRLRQAAERQIAALQRERGVQVKTRPFFPGISDMSFLGAAGSPAELAAVTENTPAWGTRIRFDYQAAGALDLPVVNIGPWGRDYHQRNERVYMPYSFEALPELIWRIAEDLWVAP